MRTFANVLSRKHERDNLKQVAFCVVLTVALVFAGFGLVHVKHLVETKPDPRRSAATSKTTNASQLESLASKAEVE